MQLIVNLNPKVVVGNFSDKSHFVFWKKLASNNQKIFMTLDGYIYPQLNDLSYTICDTLCVTMSSEIDHIDPSTNLFDDAIVIGPLPLKTPQNPSHHGEVQNEKFPPAQLNILVASMQLDPPLWDNIFHERFFENLLQAMRRFGHHKFLIKEKKG